MVQVFPHVCWLPKQYQLVGEFGKYRPSTQTEVANGPKKGTVFLATNISFLAIQSVDTEPEGLSSLPQLWSYLSLLAALVSIAMGSIVCAPRLFVSNPGLLQVIRAFTYAEDRPVTIDSTSKLWSSSLAFHLNSSCTGLVIVFVIGSKELTLVFSFIVVSCFSVWRYYLAASSMEQLFNLLLLVFLVYSCFSGSSAAGWSRNPVMTSTPRTDNNRLCARLHPLPMVPHAIFHRPSLAKSLYPYTLNIAGCICIPQTVHHKSWQWLSRLKNPIRLLPTTGYICKNLFILSIPPVRPQARFRFPPAN